MHLLGPQFARSTLCRDGRTAECTLQLEGCPANTATTTSCSERPQHAASPFASSKPRSSLAAAAATSAGSTGLAPPPFLTSALGRSWQGIVWRAEPHSQAPLKTHKRPSTPPMKLKSLHQTWSRRATSRLRPASGFTRYDLFHAMRHIYTLHVPPCSLSFPAVTIFTESTSFCRWSRCFSRCFPSAVTRSELSVDANVLSTVRSQSLERAEKLLWTQSTHSPPTKLTIRVFIAFAPHDSFPKPSPPTS